MTEVSKDTYRQFFTSLGFEEDPFAYTNADEEDRLPRYFIPPSYFPSVFGDPDRPKSFVVFAPRGGGKSAQRRMIENRSAESNVLSITYDQFDFPEVKSVSEITIHHHLRKIIRFSVMGLLITLNANTALRETLSKHDKEVLLGLSADHLKGVNEYALKKALDSLKSLKDKVQDFWNEWLPVINIGLSALFKRLLDVDVDNLDKYESGKSTNAPYLKYQLELVVGLARKLGYKSIYVLIDRVDESALTGNNAIASFRLIEPLLRDLELLETNGIGFKFFLWDQLEPKYIEIARTDRIRHETLEWENSMLRDMWGRRLLAYSNDKVSTLGQLQDLKSYYPIDDLALIFANHSPRDMIRIGAQIISEQQEIDLHSQKISPDAVYRGIEKFCSRRATEVVTEPTLHDLRRIPQVDFTIPYLANKVFREKQTNTRNRIYRWRHDGAVVDIDRIDDPNSQQLRPVKLFAVKDIRVAKVMFSDLEIPKFLKLKYRECPRCQASVIRDWGEDDSLPRCHDCQFDLSSEESKDTWEIWRRREFAKQVRRKERKEQLEYTQSTLDFSGGEK
jgi:hypothetical protein